jgi:RNA-directed DNA polymerase
MSLGGALHQKPGQPGRTGAGRGEVASEAVSDEAMLARRAQTDWGADDVLGQALARENMACARKRVKANKGSAGVDGRTVRDTGEYLKQAWPDIRARLLDDSPAGHTAQAVAAREDDLPRATQAWRECGPGGTNRRQRAALVA